MFKEGRVQLETKNWIDIVCLHCCPLCSFWQERAIIFFNWTWVCFFLQDVSKINEGKQPLYQDDTNKRILNSLELLNGLDEDAIDAKRLQHPQAEMIEQEWVVLWLYHAVCTMTA